jgi:hypothetical protein
MITINLLGANFLVTIACIILMIIAGAYGDSSKKTAWMFFLGPVALTILVCYWAIQLIMMIF